MKFASGISDSVQVFEATRQACQQALDQLRGVPCHLACVFASPIYRTQWTEVLHAIHEQLKPAVLVGCSGSGVIGGEQELEWVPGLSVVAAYLPGVRLHPFAVSPEELEDSRAGGFWIDKIGAVPSDEPVFVLMADPYTCDSSKLLAELNQTFPKRPIIGGLASGGNEPGEHVLFHDTEVLRAGVVGLALTGNVTMDTVISQGCRAIGKPFIVTKAEDNIIRELGGRQALDVLREVLMGLPPTDQELAQRSIFVGVVIDEMRPQFQAGDFLIRQLAGIDPPSGAIAVAEQVHVGQTVQFHLRDPGASKQELRRLLAERSTMLQMAPPAGALVRAPRVVNHLVIWPSGYLVS